MKKQIYQLVINKGKKTVKPILASYGNNRSTELYIQSTGILISCVSSAQKDPEDILYGEDALFADMLRKALLLYVIRYNHYLTITTASVMVNDNLVVSYSLKNNGFPLIYSLSEGQLREKFTHTWYAEGIKTVIACTSNSSYDGRFSALHALLAAKSDRYEIERFTYYWMAMNGLYNHIAAEGEKLPETPGIMVPLGTDSQKQEYMIRCIGFEPVYPCGEKKQDKDLHTKRIIWHILPVIRSIPEKDIDSFCEACLVSDETNPYVQKVYSAIDRMNIKNGYQETYPIYPFMAVWLPYKIRCSSFHGEKALPTFCYKDDSLIGALRVINRLLDRFLTEQLPFWLDENKSTERKELLERAAMNPAYKTKKK